MKIKGIIFGDLVNYKKPCMVIEMPKCTFKCDKECGKQVCQNSILTTTTDIDIPAEKIVEFYLQDEISQAICFQGLEPFDSWEELYKLIKLFREKVQDEIIIYTGYTEEELNNKLFYLKLYYKIIIKFGRFIPDQNPHYDKILGVNLASNNQYAKIIS